MFYAITNIVESGVKHHDPTLFIIQNIWEGKKAQQ
jgi:hypothetical protein